MKKSFGELIREYREIAGLPLRKVAAHIDIDPSTLSKIERGERSAHKEMIPLLAEILKVSEQDLILSLLNGINCASMLLKQELKFRKCQILLAFKLKILLKV